VSRQPPANATTKQGLGLVVERYPQQCIVIADGIEVILLGVKGDRAKLGVIAPEGVSVSRKEASRRRRGAH
jgi:carbon storage regulator CsrA